MNTLMTIPDNVPLDVVAARMLKEERATKLCMLADAIENIAIADDGSIKLSFRNHVIVTSNGHQVYYTPNGMIIHQAEHLHLNPISKNRVHNYRQLVFPIISRCLDIELKFKWYTKEQYEKKLISVKEK